MRVIKNPIELECRLDILLSQWKIINKAEVNNKSIKLNKLNNWIVVVNNLLSEVNNIIVNKKVNNVIK